MVAAKTDGRRNPADALEAADLGKNFVAPPLNLFEHLLGVRDRAFGIEPSLRLEGLVPDCSGLRFEIALGLREAPPRRGALSPDRSGEHTSELQSLMRISYAVFFLQKNNLNTYNYAQR